MQFALIRHLCRVTRVPDRVIRVPAQFILITLKAMNFDVVFAVAVGSAVYATRTDTNSKQLADRPADNHQLKESLGTH